MKRILTLMGLFVLGSGTLVIAQPPPADPDAKGTVSLAVKKNENGKVTLTLTRGASTGYALGSVTVFAVPQSGGRVDAFAVTFLQGADDPPQTTTDVLIDLPNGTFDLWAHHAVEPVPPNPAASSVGSALVPVTVTNSNTQAPESGGGMVMTVTRVTVDAFKASGTYSPAPNYTVEDGQVPFYTIPTGGGVIRALNSGATLNNGKYDWKTDPNVLYVPSALKYNALAVLKVKKTDNTNAHLLGTAWAKDK